MVKHNHERRLAAILAADMVGYSRLMEADEAGTLATLKDHRNELIDPTLNAHNGRIVKTTGDGMLVEFASVVDAVNAAVAIQRAMVKRNLGLAADKQIQFRVGINLGDIIIDGEDIYGDGVNIAARLEQLAEPGGVYLSGAAYEQLKGKVDVGFVDLGTQQVKNIQNPVRVYHALLEPESSRVEAGEESPAGAPGRRTATALVVIAVLAIVGGAAWWQFLKPEPASGPVAQTGIATPDERSIAVLPFNNMSDDKNQDYFADGISEDIITDLSKVSGLFVVARNTSFQYRGGALNLSELGQRLGVKYILEGSVRRAGDQVRITAQLIDTPTNGHVWAERYDGSLSDVFAAQDKVTRQIIEALRVQLTPEEQKAVQYRGTRNPAAYDAYLRGLKLLSDRRRIDIEGNAAAQAAFKEAIGIDPNYAQAMAGLAWAKWLYVATINYFNDTPRQEAVKLANKSLEVSDNALAHRILAREHFAMESEFLFTSRNAEKAVEQLEAARRLQPNNSDVLADLAMVQSFDGAPDQALANIRKAMELNPNHPDWYYGASGIALLLTGDAKTAADHLRKWSNADTSWRIPYIFLASALASSGDIEGAKEAVQKHSNIYGPGSRTTLRGIQYKWPMKEAEKETFQKGLKLAGVE